MQIFAFRCELQRFTMVICCISVVNSLQNHCNFMVNRCNFIVKISTICKVFTLIVMCYIMMFGSPMQRSMRKICGCDPVAIPLQNAKKCNEIATDLYCTSLQIAMILQLHFIVNRCKMQRATTGNYIFTRLNK